MWGPMKSDDERFSRLVSWLVIALILCELSLKIEKKKKRKIRRMSVDLEH